MKAIIQKVLFITLLIITGSCGQRSHNHDEHDHGSDDAMEVGENQALYDEVMTVHDEVMPKMNDLYKLKEELKTRITDTQAMPADKKKEIEDLILKLDSASEGMMVWMRNFNPLPDSLGEEQAKEYLENEMVKVKKVRAEVYEAIEKATGTN